MNSTELPAWQKIEHALRQADQLARSGRPMEAERALRALLMLYPQAVNALNYLAILLKDRGELVEAEATIRRAVEMAPKEAPLHNTLGNVLQRQQRHADAESSYRSAIAAKPDYAQAYFNLGISLSELGRDEEALAAFRRALTHQANYTAATIQIAMLRTKGGEHQEALDLLAPIMAADPRNFAAHYYTGHTLTALNRFDEAIAMLEKARDLSPGSPEGMFALGNAHNGAGHDDAALAAYRAAIDLQPDYLDAHYAYNLLAWTMGRHDLVLTSYADARARLGEHPDLLLAEAAQRIRQDDAAGAQSLLQRARDVAPARRDIGNALATAMTMQKRFGDAVDILAEAAAAEPANILHHRELGIALLQDAQFAPARAALETALALDPHDQLTLAYLTLAYRELGDSQFTRLFDPTKYVRSFDLAPPRSHADAASFNNALGEELIRLHTRHNEPFDQTARGGSQTIGHLFDQTGATIGALRERIDEAVAQYIRDLPSDASHPLLGRTAHGGDFSYSGAWSCRLRSGGFHTNHVHHMGWLSSAYYVSLPDAVEDGHQGWLKFGESRLGLGENDRPSRLEKPAVGKLVLFPSYYWHGTQAFVGTDPRLAVAFDVLPKTK
jgi:tetratricopeptide (TPR) repeat protein